MKSQIPSGAWVIFGLILQELIKFNHKGNFDRVMALMIGMYHTQELYNAEVSEVLGDRSVDDWFDQQYK